MWEGRGALHPCWLGIQVQQITPQTMFVVNTYSKDSVGLLTYAFILAHAAPLRYQSGIHL